MWEYTVSTKEWNKQHGWGFVQSKCILSSKMYSVFCFLHLLRGGSRAVFQNDCSISTRFIVLRSPFKKIWSQSYCTLNSLLLTDSTLLPSCGNLTELHSRVAFQLSAWYLNIDRFCVDLSTLSRKWRQSFAIVGIEQKIIHQLLWYLILSVLKNLVWTNVYVWVR